jgi:hypothetical protein
VRYGRRSKLPWAALIVALIAASAGLHGQGGGASMTVTSATTCQGADGGGPGSLYNFGQLEQLWTNAGGPADAEQDAAAIGLAESAGCSTDLDTTDNGGTQTSWGLWQVSNGTHSAPVTDVLNPAVNAEQAVAKYEGAGDSFSPWGTYNSDAYEQFLPGG